MKNFTFIALSIALSTSLNAQTPVLDSVQMGDQYANEIYYKLEDGTKSSQAVADWHIGFATSAQSTTIFSNAKNTIVKLWPNGKNTEFDTNIDLTDIASWPTLINDSTTWNDGGAFNQNALGFFTNMGAPSHIDVGWGEYRFSDHIVWGDSIYLVIVGTDVYKVDFIKKQTGNITLRFAKADVTTGGAEVTINGPSYGKRNIFFNLADGQIKDRELAGWDLWAIQYHDWYGSQSNQVVTGILASPHWEVSKVNVGAGNQATHTDTDAGSYSYKKNALGQSYKYLNPAFQWVVTNSDIYYLRDTTGVIWKWYPTKFQGSGFGKTVFYKQKVATAGLTEEGTQFVEIFPNPAKEQLTVVFDSKAGSADIIVRNQMGQIVAFENLNTSIGITQQKLDISALANGLYYVEINQNGIATVKNVVKH